MLHMTTWQYKARLTRIYTFAINVLLSLVCFASRRIYLNAKHSGILNETQTQAEAVGDILNCAEAQIIRVDFRTPQSQHADTVWPWRLGLQHWEFLGPLWWRPPASQWPSVLDCCTADPTGHHRHPTGHLQQRVHILHIICIYVTLRTEQNWPGWQGECIRDQLSTCNCYKTNWRVTLIAKWLSAWKCCTGSPCDSAACLRYTQSPATPFHLNNFHICS